MTFLKRNELCELRMFYPWPIGSDSTVLDPSLKIALNYLELTGQADNHDEVQSTAAATLGAWRRGTKHPVRLGNLGIRAVEETQEPLSRVHSL